MTKIRENAIYLAWLIALIGFCASVFYGEILGNPPCPLCWYQRIALFPLVVLLGIAAYRKESVIIPYVIPIVFAGAFVALFHLLEPHIAWLQKASVCHLGVPCSHSGFFLFGVNAFVVLSVVGFFCIALLLLIAKR
jgi:disulfide bond formation protein DsbB